MHISRILCVLLAMVAAAILAAPAEETGLAHSKRLAIDLSVATPAFLIRVPFTVSSGAVVVSGNINIYYRASRSVKVVGGVGQRYRAVISMTTFMYFFEYSVVGQFGVSSVASMSQDVVYMSRVTADIWSLNVSGFAAIT